MWLLHPGHHCSSDLLGPPHLSFRMQGPKDTLPLATAVFVVAPGPAAASVAFMGFSGLLSASVPAILSVSLSCSVVSAGVSGTVLAASVAPAGDSGGLMLLLLLWLLY